MAKIVSCNKYFDASENSWPLTIGKLPTENCHRRAVNRELRTKNYELRTYIRLGMVLAFWLVCPFLLPAQYRLQIKAVDKDSAFVYSTLHLESNFRNEALAQEYITSLPALLQSKGYAAASIDTVMYDSLGAICSLYVGETFQWARLQVDSADRKLLDAINFNLKSNKQALSFDQVLAAQQKLLDYLENNGYPFAKIKLDSITFVDQQLQAYLKIHKGPLYKIDSIRNFGTAKISATFLQRYLGILNGSYYKKERLQTVSKKLNDLAYVQEQQPWNLTMLGTGSILNVYLTPKKSSQVNVLVGFLPSSTQTEDNKLQITGEATVNLKNSLGNGESIGINWQQIQVKSPRLDLSFQQPYLFGSPFGVNASFNLFKKDSSFININMQAGAQYALSASQGGTVFIQSFQTNVLTVDTVLVKNSHVLPEQADIRSINLGINYEWFNTDYRYNPRKGNEWQLSISAGSKKIKKNTVIVGLKDESDPDFNFNSLYDTVKLNSYQFRLKASLAHYFKLNRFSTLKTAVNGGWFQSPAIFRNELFQIGGYKLLRGFDEESIFASQYAVGTLEYRYLVGRNSYLFYFIDGGWSKNTAVYTRSSNYYWGTGLGMAFETKAGIFNLSYAVGKRDDVKFNMRQSKIHIGYVNYF
jgi:outer membrane translocation and assembly module TamA